MRILIRHAEKEYGNGQSSTLTHDPGITTVGRLTSRLLALFLLKEYGLPHLIICSPYRRCRETAIEMALILPQPVPIKCDISISEYLGNRTEEKLDVDPETSKYHPPHPENFNQMDCRVRRHNDIMCELDDQPEVIWFITHGIILHRLINSIGYRLRRNLPYLSTILIQNRECYTIADDGRLVPVQRRIKRVK